MTQTETGLKRNAVTNETGSYTLTNLPIGPYRLEAVLPGFRTYAQSGIVLQVNDNPIVNAVLEVGQVTETVEVQANAALVETRTTTVGQVIDNQRVLELPLNGRQVTELVLLSGVAVVGGVNANNSGIRNYPTTTISVAGGAGNGIVICWMERRTTIPTTIWDCRCRSPMRCKNSKLKAAPVPRNTATRIRHHECRDEVRTNEFHGDAEFPRMELNARNAYALKQMT